MGRNRGRFSFRQDPDVPPPDPALLPILGTDVVVAAALIRIHQFNGVRRNEQADGRPAGGRITAEVDVPSDDGFLGQGEAGGQGDENEEQSEGGESRSSPWTRHWSLQSPHRAPLVHSSSASPDWQVMTAVHWSVTRQGHVNGDPVLTPC